MFAAGLAASTCKKNEEQVAMGPRWSPARKIREKRIRVIAVGGHRVFPVTDAAIHR
jgi:hypothetical protein